MARERRIPIESDADIVTARHVVREMSKELRLTAGDLTLVATAVSEIARNIVSYAKRGEITIQIVEQGSRRGVLVVARDQGPGIPDIGLAMTDGYSTGRSLGLGLPGARRLMDEFSIESEVGKGTTVSMTKWERQA